MPGSRHVGWAPWGREGARGEPGSALSALRGPALETVRLGREGVTGCFHCLASSDVVFLFIFILLFFLIPKCP